MSSGTCADLASRIVGLASSGVNIISSSVGQMQCGAGDGNPAYDPISSAVTTTQFPVQSQRQRIPITHCSFRRLVTMRSSIGLAL